MKRWLSVLTPAARLSLWKVLLLSALAAGVQVLLFLTVPLDTQYDPHNVSLSLEGVVHQGNLSLAFSVGFVLVCAALVLPGVERGAKTSYALRRLR